MYGFYKAFLIKWLTIGWLCGFTLSICLVFYTPIFESGIYPLPSKWGLVTVLSLIFTGLMYEWALIKDHGRLYRWHADIFMKALPRINFLSPEAAIFDSLVLLWLVIIMVVFTALAWIYPSIVTLSNWIVGLCAASMGNYTLREEENAPKETVHNITFYMSMIIFFIILLIFIGLSVSGLSYDQSNQEPFVFIFTAASWFSFGILGALIPKLLRRIRDRSIGKSRKHKKAIKSDA